MAGEYRTRELTSEGPKRSGGAPRRGRSVTVNLCESPIGWLFSRGHLTERQFNAGERLREDFEKAQMAPSVTMRWDPVRIRGSASDKDLTASERQLAARDRFDGAVEAAGPGLSDVLWRVVCNHQSLADAERALEWPARSGKLVLKLALDRVAGFYRVT